MTKLHYSCSNCEKQEVTCEWIKYDYRTMCPKNHGDVDNPYWRIPTDMKHLLYCPYCGKRIRLAMIEKHGHCDGLK